MQYRKNISPLHRLARLLMALVGAGLTVAGVLDEALLIPVGLGIVILALTGVVGWCPMCAMAGLGKRTK